MLCIIENFFEYLGKQSHELGLYFSAWLPPDSALLAKDRSHQGVEGAKALEFRWFPVETIEEVNLRPNLLKAAIAGGRSGVQHYVQRG